MFDRLTDTARGVIDAAGSEARDLRHASVGTEHVLLGLFHARDGIAAQALNQLGLDEETVRSDVIAIVGVGEREPTGNIAFSQHAKKVLELSLREAWQLGHDQIGAEHILLAIQRVSASGAATILANHVQDTDDISRTLLQLMKARA